MHTHILSSSQTDLFHLLRSARKRGFYMVGGTAIALHIGHRESIDFDLFRAKNFRGNRVQSILDDAKLRWQVLHVHEEGQYTGVIQEVKTTFFYYPFAIQASCELKDALMIPDLLTLAAMKAYALGRRAKWKDYVDLYFIMHDYYTLSEIIQKSQEIFGVYFQSAQFIEQLAYHEDINYDEVVEYLIPDPPTDAQVKAFLIERAIED